MIKQLKLINWKSFEEGVLYIDPLTILIGNNASGKSNTLDALLFLNRVASGVGVFQAINGDLNLQPIRGGVEWVCRKPENEFTLEVLIENQSIEYQYTLTVLVSNSKAEITSEKLVQVSYSGPKSIRKEKSLFYTKLKEQDAISITAYFSNDKQGKGQNFDLNRNILVLYQAESLSLRKKDIQEASKIVLDQLKNIFVFDPIPSHMRNYSSFSEKLMSDGSNLAGVLAAFEGSYKSLIEAELTRYLKEIPERDIEKVWAEPVGKFQNDAMLYCEGSWGFGERQLVDARGMSDGTLRYLAIVTAMLTRKEGQLLVIEEVDNGLHPSRTKILINMLQEIGAKRQIDVIITTHNPALLDAAGPKMIPFITVAHRNEKNGFSNLTLLEDINELPKLLSMGTVGQLSTTGKLETVLSSEEYAK